MYVPGSPARMGLAAAFLVAALGLGMPAAAAVQAQAPAAAPSLDDATCLGCHDGRRELTSLPTADDDETHTLKAIHKERFGKGVHGEMSCVTCHREIADSRTPHTKTDAPKPDCATCHEALWEDVKKQDLAEEKSRLGIVVKNIEAYRSSFHAKRKGKGVKAACDDCHDTHYFNVPPRGTAKRTAWHLTVPQVCGASCHDDVLDEYKDSVHGVAALKDGNPKSAVCTDCHTTHGIAKTASDETELLIVENCGGCHKENLATYRDTYHGQVGKLGYAYTAKCFDCHGSHDVRKVDDPASKVHVANRLKTCQQCHDGEKRGLATAGFVSYSPHADPNDFERYPQVYVAKKFMDGLLVFVFAYFWVHTLLWWYREAKERRERTAQAHVRTDEALQGETRQVRRFGLAWRIGHLFFATSIMVLVLTGMGLFYPGTPWAQTAVRTLGGPEVTGIIHRTCAVIMLGIFFIHLVAVTVIIWRKRATWRWFGPDSLVPNWKDILDAWGMFRWFVGRGERPIFDRWTYWEKFDYWAVFWGMAIIGVSGTMLAFPEFTATFLPGWVFNVGTVVHGEEAFMAAVFLFTVHFFNNNFRPDKMPPPNVTMFTGLQTLDEFRREHPAQYQRLVESGELEKYLVRAPSLPMTIGSRILGLVLIAFGLFLLVFVGIGFFGR